MGNTFFPKARTTNGWAYDFCNGVVITNKNTKVAEPKPIIREISTDNWLKF